MGSSPESPGFRVRFKPVVEVGGEPVLDEVLARVLIGVERHGSILRAASSAGIPYSRAWDAIVRAERILGGKLVEARRGGRGGGGARLTPLAVRLLEAYQAARARLESCLGSPVEAPRVPELEPDLVVAHSNDPILDVVLDRLRAEGVRVEAASIGSGLALEALSLGDAHVACAHLLDPETGEYNWPYLERLWVRDPVLLGGWMREIVLALNPAVSSRYSNLEEALADIADGKLSVAPRNRGSGTAVLFDHILRLVRSNPSPVYTAPEAYTHREAARNVASGRAMATLTLRATAEEYSLPYLHAAWERYECYTTSGLRHSTHVRRFEEAINSQWLTEMIERTPGYKPLRGR